MKTSLPFLRLTRARTAAAALVVCAALISSCDESPTGARPGEPKPPSGMKPLGIVEVTITGVGSSQARATASGVRLNLTRPQNGGGTADGSIQLEQVSTGSFTEGTRGADGQRYVYATFRVRNAQSDGTAYDTPRRNLTFLAVNTGRSVPGTPVASMRRFDGSVADTAIAAMVVPTGAVALGDSLQMRSLRADVLQAFTEGELPAKPAGVDEIFPYGFVVSNPNNGASRDLPASPARDQFDGLVTFAFRLPLQPHDAGTTNGATKDIFTLSVHLLAVDDSETRLTESVEEQTAAGRAAIDARRAALGAATVTVLNGSPATAFNAYPGQRQLCAVRTAGPAGAPRTTVNAPGAYTRLAFYTGMEARDACAAGFRTGAAARPAVGVAFPVRVYSMDRYGNTIIAVADSAMLVSKTSGTTPPVTHSAGARLVNGEAALSATYGGYGVDTLYAVGRRTRGALSVRVAGLGRVWEGDVSDDWDEGGNWNLGARPYPLDTVYVPVVASAVYPRFQENEEIGGVSVSDGAQISLGAWNLTASGSVASSALTGGITSDAGHLILTGVAQNLSGRLPRLIVKGTYSLSGGVRAVAPLQVDGGRVRNTAFDMRIGQSLP